MHIVNKTPLELEENPIAKSNPDMIKSARINANIKEEDIVKFSENWKKWEDGTQPTTWEDLRLIAKFYRKPTFYYFLENPIEEEHLKDYTIQELFQELNVEFENFKKEILERLELCSHVELKDL